MAKMGDFIAFRAAVELLRERNKEKLLRDIYQMCEVQKEAPKEEVVNHVKKVYEPFSYEEISAKIAELLTPRGMKAEVEIIYQTPAGLRKSCPQHKGDWYFSGNYPTPGGNKVVNRAFMNFMEGKDQRAY